MQENAPILLTLPSSPLHFMLLIPLLSFLLSPTQQVQPARAPPCTHTITSVHGCAELLPLPSLWLTETKPACGRRDFTAEHKKLSGGSHTTTSPLHALRINLSCNTSRCQFCQRFLKAISSVLVWIRNDEQCRGKGRKKLFTSPRLLAHSSKWCHSEQQSCGCRCTLASCCKNHCETSAS